MENKNYFIKQLKYLRRVEFFSNFSKLIILLLFVMLSPIAIYEKIINSELFIALILMVAEIVFIVLSINFFSKAKEYSSIKKSRLFQCVNNPELVSEIIISKNKILFEIKGMQDETLYLKESEYRTKIIDSIVLIFGKNKVILTKHD